MLEKFELGQRVTVRSEMLVSKSNRVNPYLESIRRYDLIREWKRRELEKPVNGVIVGSRTVKEGYSRYDYEDGYEFIPKRYIQVYLVATNMRTFIRALPEDIEVIA